MRTWISLAVLCGSLAACSKDEPKPSTTTATSAAAPTATPPPEPPPPPAAAAPAEVETSADMKALVAMLDGSKESAKNALKKYGGKTVQNNEVGMFALKDAKVTKSEKLGTLECYTTESMAGTVKHSTRWCWDSTGKVAQITDKKE